MSTFADNAAERLIFADLLDGLSEDQLATQSLCGAWTVKDVGAHVLMPLITPMRRLLRAALTSRGSIDRANEQLTAEVARLPITEISRLLREHAGSHFSPPTLGHVAPLTDLLVHGQDIRRPLGLTREFEPDRLRAVLHFLASPSARRGFVPKGRLDGLRLEAEDLGWSMGHGERVAGPAEALMMAMAGRDVALDDLSGDGVAMLAARATR